MLSEIRLKNWVGLILQGGIISSIILVVIGGSMFLWEHGAESLESNLLAVTNYNIDILSIWNREHLFSALGLIELGLVVLVGAQVLRVALLCCYYTYARDVWFMIFSFFILAVILYSFIWQ